jgi:tripartite-type tricarboxylate transporter receptor subunit TctC
MYEIVRRVGTSVALLMAILVLPVQAQNWPTRAVKFIVPFGPGAGADIGARLFAEKLQAKWGQPVVVENKPGGDGIVAIQTYLGANDDHVLMFGPASSCIRSGRQCRSGGQGYRFQTEELSLSALGTRVVR